jgi:transcriptional regulator with XRE-family HTH domain
MKEFSALELNRMTDDSIIKAIGTFVRSARLEKDWTQAQLGERAGVHRTTVRDLELGKRSTLVTLIQVLRTLDELHVFKNFKVVQELSPLQLAQLEQNERRRARGSQSTDSVQKSEW